MEVMNSHINYSTVSSLLVKPHSITAVWYCQAVSCYVYV